MKIDYRKLMELAIAEMRKSVPEPRKDGKAAPKVGAVLVKPDGKVMTAHRGEIRHGDHAEFTLLERKNRDVALDGSILFATLEPCAPNSRKHPKLGCAERIALARVKAVWIGIEDPDPTVDRKGIKYLEDCGVEIHMFDRDLQETIRAENKDFIAQAMQRAAEVEKKPREITLSPLETAREHSNIEALSTEALNAYRDHAKMADAVGSPEFNRRLAGLGLLKQDGERFAPTGFGLVLFGKEPRTAMPQVGLLGTIHHADGNEEIKDFVGPQILVPEQVIQWLRDKLPDLIDRSEARRQHLNDAFFELVREGVVNALVHRDYNIEGAKCQLLVTPDTIEIRSPGKPIAPITLEQMQAFTAPMLSRNPIIHFVFSQMELAEERGLGLRSMKNRAQSSMLPLPAYVWDDPYLILRVFRKASAAVDSLPANIRSEFTEPERAGWQWLTTQRRAKSVDYARAMNVPERTSRRHLNQFVDLGLLRKTGSARATVYEVSNPFTEIPGKKRTPTSRLNVKKRKKKRKK